MKKKIFLINNRKHLEILLYDENPFVRKAVAEEGYGLNKLINDEIYFVREAVARQGYGLDILVNDEDPEVREIARKVLNEK